MTTPDWPAFLTARLDEQETLLRKIDGQPHGIPVLTLLQQVRADAAAKRAILDDYRRTVSDLGILESKLERARVVDAGILAYQVKSLEAELRDTEVALGVLGRVICHLCRPFADHPDYQE